MIIGKFIKECNNRFLCLVEINGVVTECYISSSSKLGKYIKLENRKVLLMRNKGKNLRTLYTLQAVQVRGRWILLNLNCLNEYYLEHLIKERKFNFAEIKREATIDGYKTDFFIENKKHIIEVKGVLSEGNEAVYPVVSCGRTLRQLAAIKTKLKEGYSVDYVFVLMNSEVNTILLNKNDTQLVNLFYECISLGMTVKYCVIRWYKHKCHIKTCENCSTI